MDRRQILSGLVMSPVVALLSSQKEAVATSQSNQIVINPDNLPVLRYGEGEDFNQTVQNLFKNVEWQEENIYGSSFSSPVRKRFVWLEKENALFYSYPDYNIGEKFWGHVEIKEINERRIGKYSYYRIFPTKKSFKFQSISDRFYGNNIVEEEMLH